MKLTCDEATTICDKSQYGAASLLEKVKLNIHVMLCKKCGLYSKQNDIMTKCYKKHIEDVDNTECGLKEEEKEYMHQEIKAKI